MITFTMWATMAIAAITTYSMGSDILKILEDDEVPLTEKPKVARDKLAMLALSIFILCITILSTILHYAPTTH